MYSFDIVCVSPGWKSNYCWDSVFPYTGDDGGYFWLGTDLINYDRNHVYSICISFMILLVVGLIIFNFEFV